MKGDFDFELQTLHMRMMGEVMVVLVPFFTFASTYITTKAHNMLVLMFDLHSKSLDVVKGIVKKVKFIQMVVKYDNKSLMPLLVVAFKIQNLGAINLPEIFLSLWCWWIDFWGSGFKWNYFAWVAKKRIWIILSSTCEARRLSIAPNMVEITWNMISKFFLLQKEFLGFLGPRSRLSEFFV